MSFFERFKYWKSQRRWIGRFEIQLLGFCGALPILATIFRVRCRWAPLLSRIWAEQWHQDAFQP